MYMHVTMHANCTFQLLFRWSKLREWETWSRRWQNEISATDEDGMSGANHDNAISQADDDRISVRQTKTEWVVPTMAMRYVRQTMTEWDQCDRRRGNEWCQTWQNVIRQADDERMRPVWQTIKGTYGILNGKHERNKIIWSFMVEVCGLNDVIYG